jgi:hypothetical protein
VTKLVQFVDHNSPFYPQGIYETPNQLVRIALKEQNDIAVDIEDALTLAGRHRGKENFDQYLALAEKLSAQIRDRLAKLSVRGLSLQ